MESPDAKSTPTTRTTGRSAPAAHLREKNFDVKQGVKKATDLLDGWSFIALKD